jgi:hypothetical protein
VVVEGLVHLTAHLTDVDSDAKSGDCTDDSPRDHLVIVVLHDVRGRLKRCIDHRSFFIIYKQTYKYIYIYIYRLRSIYHEYQSYMHTHMNLVESIALSYSYRLGTCYL